MRRRHSRGSRFGLLLALFALTACGQPGGASLSSGLSASADAGQRLASLTALDERVARVAQRLSDANAELCPTVRLSAGWSLHAANQYSQDLRPLAEAQFGLEGDLPGILVAPPDSAAAVAGLRRGDLILGVDGVALDRGRPRGPPAFEGLAANLRALDIALSRGPVVLTIRRDGMVRQMALQPRRSCGYDVQLDPSNEFRGRADGRRVFISTALAGFTVSDDELALLLGHELAHHVLRHRSWDETGGGGRIENPSGGRMVADHPERQADRVGLYLAARAGFDTRQAPVFWRRFGASNWRVRFSQLTHDSAGTRAVALEAVHAEIEDLRRAGKPLVP